MSPLQWLCVFSLGTPCLLSPGGSAHLDQNQGVTQWQHSVTEFLQLRIFWMIFHTFSLYLSLPFSQHGGQTLSYFRGPYEITFTNVLSLFLCGLYIFFLIILLSVLRFVVTCPFLPSSIWIYIENQPFSWLLWNYSFVCVCLSVFLPPPPIY